MNLEEFLNYQTQCLACGSTLKTAFHSNKKQNVNIINDRFEAKFKLGKLHHKQKTYDVLFSIGLKDNSFYIDFYDKDSLFDNSINISIINRFKEFDVNNGSYQIFRFCKCNKYNYISNSFKLDYKNLRIKDLIINTEFVELKNNNSYYEVINWYDAKETWFSVNKIPFDTHCIMPSTIKIPLIKMNDKNYLINRLNSLLIFT
jgi:hypothetical protein